MNEPPLKYINAQLKLSRAASPVVEANKSGYQETFLK
jgi:hypothetical protein